MISEEQIKKEWFLLERLHHYPPITLEPACVAMTTDLAPLGLTNVLYGILEYKEGTTIMHYPYEEWHTAAKLSCEAIKKDPGIMDQVHKESDTLLVPQIRELSWKFVTEDFGNYSNEELLATYQKLYALKARLQFIRAIGWLIETPGEYFSAYLIQYLQGLVTKHHLSDDPVLIFSALTNPTKRSLVNEEHVALLRLAERAEGGNLSATPDTPEIQAHAKKYGFLPFGCEGPGWTALDVVTHINEILHAGVAINIAKQIADQEAQFAAKKNEQAAIYARVPIDEHHRHLLQVAQDIVYQKSWSKEHNYLAWYALDFLLRAIAKRLYLTIQQVRYLLPHELTSALRGETEPDPSELEQRYQYSLLVIEPGSASIVTGDRAKEMKAAMNIRVEATDVSDTHEFSGQSAVPGKATGTVKVINSTAEMEKMKPGDILVSEMTIPEIVAAMKKAAAIVTDMGGITCHAAIVSRELGIPCVIGTKIATKVLKDGDMVEVDATRGVVKKTTAEHR